jgi:hypothetical protein
MKEPGELAYEAWVKAYGGTTIPWDKLGDDERDEWAAVESAIRADEAAKVRAATIEECAKVAENYSNAEPGDICEVMAGDWQHGIAAALRAKIGDRNG